MIFCKFKKNFGFTLVELMIVIAMMGTLAGIAVPVFSSYIDRTKVARAKIDIRTIEKEITSFLLERERLPSDLSEIGLDGILDPYGNPYQYLPATVSEKPGKAKPGGDAGGNPGGMRMDRNLHPVNTDYDLYSMGKDGKTTAPFTAKISQDDIVRANNGQFIGLVSAY